MLCMLCYVVVWCVGGVPLHIYTVCGVVCSVGVYAVFFSEPIFLDIEIV